MENILTLMEKQTRMPFKLIIVHDFERFVVVHFLIVFPGAPCYNRTIIIHKKPYVKFMFLY